MQAAGQKRAATGDRSKAKGSDDAQDVTALKDEAERLRKQLATEQERVRTLETANIRAAERLDAAIQSVKSIIARQG